VSEAVRLRPVREDDLEVLEGMSGDPDKIGFFNWHGFSDTRYWRRRFEKNGLLGGERRALMVETAAGECAGFVSWGAVNPGTPYEYWEIGISLLPEARGLGYGTEAQRQLVRYLFSHTRANRIQAGTDSENFAEQRALEKAGFTREGVLRGIAFRAGRWCDDVIYGIVRAEVTLP
jgi:RimJ/RimL family protein N-acetyltransferase